MPNGRNHGRIPGVAPPRPGEQPPHVYALTPFELRADIAARVQFAQNELPATGEPPPKLEGELAALTIALQLVDITVCCERDGEPVPSRDVNEILREVSGE